MPAKKTVRRLTNQHPDNQVPDEDEDVNPEEPENDDTETTPEEETASEEDSAQADESPRMIGAPRDGRTFASGQKIKFKARKEGGVLRVQENVYRGVKPPGSERWRYHLVLGRGSEVPVSKAKEISEDEYESEMNVLY